MPSLVFSSWFSNTKHCFFLDEYALSSIREKVFCATDGDHFRTPQSIKSRVVDPSPSRYIYKSNEGSKTVIGENTTKRL